MNAPSLPDLLACAEEAVRRAGAHARANLHRRTEAVARTAHDVKLALDHECQRLIESVIQAAFPSHAILGEEGDRAGTGSRHEWIVDPLDGTVNFSHGLPYWCHSVAVRRDGETVAGAVLAPLYGELYAATADGLATCNGAPIAVSATARLADSLLLTGIEKNFDQHSQSLDVARAVALAVQKFRLMGAAALDLCMVAAGRADGFYESGIHLWDVAAGELIVRRAGGTVLELAQVGSRTLRYIATNGLIHKEFLSLLSRFEAWAPRPTRVGANPWLASD